MAVEAIYFLSGESNRTFPKVVGQNRLPGDVNFDLELLPWVIAWEFVNAGVLVSWHDPNASLRPVGEAENSSLTGRHVADPEDVLVPEACFQPCKILAWVLP